VTRWHSVGIRGDDDRLARRWTSASKQDDGQTPVRVVPVPSAVVALLLLLKIVDPIEFFDLTRPLEIRNDLVPLLIDLGADMVGDLTGGVAEAYAPIESCRSEPGPSSFGVLLIGAPKADVMSLSRVVPHFPLESEILLSSPQEQVADRRIFVRPVKERAASDL